MTTVGFIGTGNIGNPMATRILEAGHALRVCDARREAAASLIDAGAQWAETPQALAAECDLIFSSLPGPAQLETVVRGEAGLLRAQRKGWVHVDLSTISLSTAQSLRRIEADAGVEFIDCPVSGGTVLAARGALTLMASGERSAFDRAEPILQALGKRILYLGADAGTGTLFKLINNAIFLGAAQLAQEGVVMAAKAGLDLKQLHETLSISSAGMFCGMLATTLQRDFDGEGFSLALAEKDLSLALSTARELGVPMPATTASHQTYLRGVAAGAGEKLFPATLEVLERDAGIEIPAIDVKDV